MGQCAQQRFPAVAPGIELLHEHHQQVHGVAHADREHERRQDLSGEREAVAQQLAHADGRNNCQHDDDHGDQDRHDASQEQKEQPAHHDERHAKETRHLATHGQGEFVGEQHAAGYLNRKLRHPVARHDILHRKHDRVVLRPGDERPLTRGAVFEATELVLVEANRGVRVGLHEDVRDATVGGDDSVEIQRRAHHPRAQRLDFRRARRHLLEQIFDDQFIADAQRRADIHQARHFFEMRNARLEILVQRSQPLEKVEVEDVRGLDRNDHELVAPELIAQLVVGDLDRVVAAQKPLGRSVDLDPGKAGSQGERQTHHHDDHQPGPAPDRRSP